MTKLFLASNNKGKILEIQSLLSELEVDLVTPIQIGLQLEVEEDGETYAENAARKAVAFSQASGMFTLADDSGLEIDILGGLPGIHSARFAPNPGATDADRRAYLLQRLTGHPRPWQARFHCTLALATPSGELHFGNGVCPGEIIPEERGDNGFGYDPIFLIPKLGRTMAELSLDEKNFFSHRARAVRAFWSILAEMVNAVA